MLAFSAPLLGMLVELRGCLSVHRSRSHDTIGNGAVLGCVVERKDDNGETVGTSGVSISVPTEAGGTTIYRRNGTSRLCPAGTAANLLSIYEGGTSEGAKGKGRARARARASRKGRGAGRRRSI